MILETLALLCVLQQPEPPRAQFGFEAGSAVQVGSRFTGALGGEYTEGAQFKLDARYRFLNAVSVGAFGQYVRHRTQPAASQLLIADQFRAGSLVRIGALFGVAHRFWFLCLGLELGFGYQHPVGDGPSAAIAYLALTALVDIGRYVSIGPSVSVTGVREIVGSFLVARSVSGQAERVGPLPYAWLNAGIRGTFQFL